MLDKDYIAEISVLEKKEAKEKLAEYAETFGIKLKKTKAFDNMVSDLEIELAKLADEPMPEQNDGLSIYDLIQADDEAKGTAIFKDETKEEARLLIDSVSFDAPQVEVVEVKEPEVFEEPTEEQNSEDETVQEKSDEVIKIDEFKLPDNFSPNLQLLGKNPGYVTLPWWIYEWIKDNPDWKSKPTSFEHPSAHQTLLSLIYYINRDGFIQIRETRNSSFVTLQ